MFHIDDLLLSNKFPNIVTLYIRKLQQEYGSREDLTVTRGQTHGYLGMTLDFTVKLEIRFSQNDFLKKLFNSLPKSMKVGRKYTAAPEYLFRTTDNSYLLNHTEKEDFHILTAKILWLSQRTHPDVQLSVGFCCTRIQGPVVRTHKKIIPQSTVISASASAPISLI